MNLVIETFSDPFIIKVTLVLMMAWGDSFSVGESQPSLARFIVAFHLGKHFDRHGGCDDAGALSSSDSRCLFA